MPSPFRPGPTTNSLEALLPHPTHQADAGLWIRSACGAAQFAALANGLGNARTLLILSMQGQIFPAARDQWKPLR